MAVNIGMVVDAAEKVVPPSCVDLYSKTQPKPALPPVGELMVRVEPSQTDVALGDLVAAVGDTGSATKVNTALAEVASQPAPVGVLVVSRQR